jgi:hypothetical protein
VCVVSWLRGREGREDAMYSATWASPIGTTSASCRGNSDELWKPWN